MTDNDEAWSESMVNRPVWVRSQPISRFPVGVRHCVVVVHPIDQPIHSAGTEEMSLVWGNELCVSQLATAETFSPGIVAWSKWCTIFFIRG